MPNYGLCCEGDGCKMRVNKMVTFHHVCVNCNQFLHLICGVVNENDQLYCNININLEYELEDYAFA